jgi:hypothetical protein
VTKEDILAAIQRAAAARGGRIGLAAFLAESGIPEKQILGKHWATWNEALSEAGVKTSSFAKPRTPEETVLEALAQFVVRLGKWPTENQLSLERRRNREFPSLSVLRRMLRAGNVKEKLLAHCAGREDLASVRDLVGQLPQLDAGNDSVNRAPVQGFVYMMRSGRRYKIGYTNSPNRRFREVRIELPDPTHIVHTIETDDPAGIEGYWHRRFASKRVRDTEFFELDSSDVAAFKRRKYQ